MCPNSKIASNMACGRTKSTHILNTVAADSVKSVSSLMTGTNTTSHRATSSIQWFSLATDGSSDEDHKYFSVLLTHLSLSGKVVTF